jgi:hypothetical protein
MTDARGLITVRPACKQMPSAQGDRGHRRLKERLQERDNHEVSLGTLVMHHKLKLSSRYIRAIASRISDVTMLNGLGSCGNTFELILDHQAGMGNSTVNVRVNRLPPPCEDW